MRVLAITAFVLGWMVMGWMAAWGAAVAAQVASPPLAPEELASLLPHDGELEGWIRDGTPILCQDEAELAEHIDGAAPYYLERGAIAVLFQYYLGPNAGEEAKVELYHMEDRESARRLFREITRGRRPSEGSDLKGLGEDRHLEQALLGIYLLEFHLGPFFVRMDAKGRGPDVRAALVRLGQRVSDSLQALDLRDR